jgi:hypothetical protein
MWTDTTLESCLRLYVSSEKRSTRFPALFLENGGLIYAGYRNIVDSGDFRGTLPFSQHMPRTCNYVALLKFLPEVWNIRALLMI